MELGLVISSSTFTLIHSEYTRWKIQKSFFPMKNRNKHPKRWIHDILHTQVFISKPFLTICTVQQLPAKTLDYHTYIQAWKQIIFNCFIFVVNLSTMVLNRDRVAVPRFYDELWMDWAGDYLLLLYLLYTTLGWINLAWWKCMNILHNCTIFYSAQQALSSQCDITVL